MLLCRLRGMFHSIHSLHHHPSVAIKDRILATTKKKFFQYTLSVPFDSMSANAVADSMLLAWVISASIFWYRKFVCYFVSHIPISLVSFCVFLYVCCVRFASFHQNKTIYSYTHFISFHYIKCSDENYTVSTLHT